MKIEISQCNCVPCQTELFKINGIDADIDWFIEKEEHGDSKEYMCSDISYYYIDVEIIKANLPKELKYLTNKNILEIQLIISNELIKGDCNLCY